MRNRDVRIDELLYVPRKKGASYSEDEKNIYGYLYGWYYVENDRIANSGWRVPSKNDWITLINEQNPLSDWNGNGWTVLNNPLIFGQRIQPEPHPRWDVGFSSGTNKLRLALYPNSLRKEDGSFPTESSDEYIGKMGFIWTSTVGVQEKEGTLVKFTKNNIGIFGNTFKGFSDKKMGCGIRLIRNATSGELSLNDGAFVDDYIGNDGKKYPAVKIGSLIWTTQNLSETKDKDGNYIPLIKDNTDWVNLNGRSCFNNDCKYSFKLTPSLDNVKLLHQKIEEKQVVYGFLYNWWCLNNIISYNEKKPNYGYLYNHFILERIANPQHDDWRVPSDNDWKALELHICIPESETNDLGWRGLNEGNKLKGKRAVPDEHPRWDNSSSHTNEYNFSAYPGGGRFETEDNFLGTDSFFWTKTNGSDKTTAWYRSLTIRTDEEPEKIFRGEIEKQKGFSVRLVRDATMNEKVLPDGEETKTYVGNDGQRYRTVKIGKQIWLKENLMETKDIHGVSIPIVSDYQKWCELNTGAMCSYDNEDSFIWNPLWRVPIKNDFEVLIQDIISGYSEINETNVGSALRSCREINSPLGGECDTTEHPRWDEFLIIILPDMTEVNIHSGFNLVGFSSLPSGLRDVFSGFQYLGQRFYIWFLTENSGVDAWLGVLMYNNGGVDLVVNSKKTGAVVRPVRDAYYEEINDKENGDSCGYYVGNDGNKYNTVKINKQVWVSENLIEKMFSDNTQIPIVENSTTWNNLDSAAMSSYNNNQNNSFVNKIKYLYLYRKDISIFDDSFNEKFN